jgi:hypothetical protein
MDREFEDEFGFRSRDPTKRDISGPSSAKKRREDDQWIDVGKSNANFLSTLRRWCSLQLSFLMIFCVNFHYYGSFS